MKILKKDKLAYLFLGLILIIHSFLLTKLLFHPYSELFIYPYLTNHGLKPYQQILDQHFPGLMFLPINLNNLGMTTPEVARIWLIGIVIITQLLLFFISREVFKSDQKALLVNFLYLIWQPFFEGWVLWIDSFLPLILLPAFYFMQKGNEGNWKIKWVFLTGLFLGLGVVFKQVLIPLFFLVLFYFFWKSKNLKILLIYLSGLIIPLGLMVLYLFNIGVLKDFWYWTIVFNLTTFAKYGKQTAPSFAHISRVSFVFGMSLISLKFWNQKVVQLLLLFLFGSLVGTYARFDFVHFQPALPYAILASVYVLGRLGEFRKEGIIWIGYLFVLVWWLANFYRGHLGNRVLLFDIQTYQLANKIMQYTNLGEKIFIFGAVPNLYQMSQTLPAGDIFVFQFPWFLMVSEDRVLQGIEKDKPSIVVSDRTVEIQGQKITEFAKDIDQYIQKNYHVLDEVGDTEILQRID